MYIIIYSHKKMKPTTTYIILCCLFALTLTADKGVDVSSYQGKVDWAKVKAAGIKFAILRGTLKAGTMDTQFEANYKGAKAQGLPVSVYHFSYALTKSKAISDVKNLISKLNGKKLPIFLDLEYSEQGALGKSKVTEIAVAWIKECQSHGYSCHIYSNKSWYTSKFYPDQLKALGCKFWIAAYGPNDGSAHSNYKPNVGEIIWQYTDKGKVNGISGTCDLNYKYGDIPDSPDTPDPEPEPQPDDPKVDDNVKMVTVICDSVNRRSEPSSSGKVVGYYHNGDKIQVIGKSSDGNWYKDDANYYFTAKSAYVKDLVGVCNCDSLYVRDKSNTSGNIITHITRGTKVNILKKAGDGWYQVKLSNGTVGYCSGKYLDLQ